MRPPTKLSNPFLALFLALIFAIAAAMLHATQVTAQEPVRVALRTDFTTNSDVVTLGELATLEGGDARTRNSMSRLDLAIDPASLGATIDKDEAVARLLIAGFAREQFRFIGPAQVRLVAPARPLPAEMIEKAIAEHVATKLEISASDVVVEVVRVPESAAIGSPEGLTLTPLDHGDQLIGNRTVVIGVFRGEQYLTQFNVPSKTHFYREVLVAKEPIERGETIGDHNSFIRRTRFDRVSAGQWVDGKVAGKKTTRRIRAQQVIRSSDLETQQKKTDTVLIHARETVTVVASKGSLVVTMSGMEAMKAGKMGDIIPLKNPASKKVVYGRVVGINQVEISF